MSSKGRTQRKEKKKCKASDGREGTDQQSPSIPRTAPSCEHNSDVLPILSI